MTAMRTCKVSWVLGSCSGLLLALGGAAACSAALPAQTGGDSAGADPGGDGPIRVSLSRGPTPIAGASVVSHDAEGAVLATYTTNPSGEVDIPGAGVEMVTVIDGEQSQAYTVVGVKPGDHIVIPTFSVVENLGTLDVTLPTPPTEAVRFHVFVGSDFNDATTAGDAIAVAVTTADIGTQGSLTVLAMAQDANYTIIAVSTATGVMPPAAGTHQALATGAWTTAFNEFHLNVGGGGNIGSLQNTTSGQTVDGVHMDLPTRSGSMPYMWWNPVPSLGGYVDYSTQIPYSAVSGAKRFWARRLAASATSDTIDITTLLPGLLATSADTIDVARPTLTWTASGSVDGADGVILNTRWNGWRWAFLLPTSQHSIRFPALPQSLAAWVPSAAVAQPYGVVVDTSYDANYDDFRSDGLGLVSGPRFLHDAEGTLSGSVYFPAF